MLDKAPNQSFSYKQSPTTGHYFPVKVTGPVKKPAITGWTTYKKSNPNDFIRDGVQVGFSIGTEILVIDIDSYKPEGKKSGKKLLDKYPELNKVPRVKTMRGGHHLFLRHGTNAKNLSKNVNTLYPGIDFLSCRMFAMCAGNPKYTWVKPVKDWDNLPMAPEGLIRVLKGEGQAVTLEDVDHSIIDAKQLGTILDQLDPNLFNGASHRSPGAYEWQELMMACAAATGCRDDSDGYRVFDEWCRRVTHYKNTGCPRPRWASIKVRKGGTSIASLFRFCDLEGVDWRSACGFGSSGEEQSDWEKLIELSELGDNDESEKLACDDNDSDENNTALSIDDILKEPRAKHRELLIALAGKDKKKYKGYTHVINRMLFIGAEKDNKLRLTDRQLALKVLKVLKYRGFNVDPVFTEDMLFLYDGSGCWKPLNSDSLKAFIISLVDNCYGITKDGQYNAISKVLYTIAADTYGDRDFFGGAPAGIPFKSKFWTLSESTGQVLQLAHSPEHKARHRFSFDPNPHLETPLYDKFCRLSIDDVTDKQINYQRQIVEQFMGAAIFGLGPTLEKCLLITGGGDNGKSQFLKLFKNMSPSSDDVAYFNLEGLRKDDGILSIYDKRFVIVSETAGALSKVKAKGSVFKALTSGDGVSTRRLYGARFNFQFKGLFVMAGNQPPEFDDAGKGLRRRFISVSMDREIPEEDKILNIADKMRDTGEIPGIAHRAIMAISEMMSSTKQYTIPPKSYDFMSNQDTVKQFVEDKCELGDDLRVTKSEIYPAYLEYCDSDLSAESISLDHFNRQIRAEYKVKQRYARAGGKRTRIWLGIQFK